MKRFNALLKFLGLDKGFVNVIGGNTLASISSAIFWLFLASIMTTGQYGELNYYLSIAFILASVSVFGLGTTVITFLSKGDEEIHYNANCLVLISSSVLSIFSFVFLHNMSLSLLSIGLSFFFMSNAEYLGRKSYKKYSYTVIIQRVINIPLSLSFYYLIGIDGILLGYAISTVLVSFNFFSSFRHLSRPQFKPLRKKFSFTLHSFFLDLSGHLSRNVDKIVIAPLFGFEILGLYQIGFQFLMFLSIIPSSMFQYLLPQMASKTIHTRIVLKGFVIALVFAVLSAFFIPVIIDNFFPQFKNSIQISQIMIFGIIPMTINSIYYSKFFGDEKSKKVLIAPYLRISSLLILLVFVGNLYGLLGLATATLASLFLETLILYVLSKSKTKPVNKFQ